MYPFRETIGSQGRERRVWEEQSFQYTIRIPANEVLMASISHLLTRPVGRPSYKPKVFYESFSYQAQSWDRPRRVVAKVEWHEGELFPRVGFIVTNMTRWSRKAVHFYNRRGTAEQWIQGRQLCGQVDAFVVPELRGQPGSASALRTCVQPGELPASVDAAEVGEALVVDHATGKADQDRCESRDALTVCDLPDG